MLSGSEAPPGSPEASLDADAEAFAYHSSADSTMSSLLAPAGTIGKTFSVTSTRKSTTTGTSPTPNALSSVDPTSSAFVQRSPTQPYASASLTRSGTSTARS